MTQYLKACAPIMLPPELIQTLSKTGLNSLVADGAITYKEGFEAGLQYHRLLQANPGFQTSYPLLHDRLVTIVSGAKNKIRVHGVTIEIEGEKHAIADLLAIGEGLRRHSPQWVQEAFTPGIDGRATRIFLAGNDTWNETIQKLGGREIEETGNRGATIEWDKHSLVFIDDGWLMDEEQLMSTTEHEFGHVFSNLLIELDQPGYRNPAQNYKKIADRDITEHQPELDDEFGRLLVSVMNPEDLQRYEHASADNKRTIRLQAIRKKSRAKIGNGYKYPVRNALAEYNIEPRCFESSIELFACLSQKYNQPEETDQLRLRLPVYANFFAHMEAANPDELPNGFLRNIDLAVLLSSIPL